MHKEGLHNLYSLRNIIRALKSRKMRWEMQEAGTKETENTYRIAVGKPEWKKQLERKIYIERKVILK
jgi:hypothetical protein